MTILLLHHPDVAKGVAGVWIQIQATGNSQTSCIKYSYVTETRIVHNFYK